MNYISGHTSEFSEFQDSIPTYLEAGGFMICTAGSGAFIVDSKRYNLKRWDLIVAFPHSYAKVIDVSDDFDGIIFGVDMDILINSELSNKSMYITSITANPHISLGEGDVDRILSLREEFLKYCNNDHPLREEINLAMVKIIICEVAALFHNSKQNCGDKNSRDEVIFNSFLVELYRQEPKERELEYFAARQHITASHLSKVVKRVSNYSASKWISDYAIISIKRLLQNRDLSITTISDRLNFPNASFLAQYFKKRTNQTPKHYRMEFFKQT